MQKYVIFNCYNYTVVEITESDFNTAKSRLNRLNNGYNQELIMLPLKRYNSLIKSLHNKLNKIKKIVTDV